MSGLISSVFSSPIFTWWNSATFGTRLFTSRKGVKVGEDDQGNLYYRERDGERRWVIYRNGPNEASRVPPEWHAWLHYTVDVPPSEQPPVTKKWEKPHKPNLTGTDGAYVPGGSLLAGAKRAASTSDYEAWRP
ncbi:NADH:ubiquinone oxidoreductase subunit NDUFA12 [Eilatimonas milleporae]|uniref:NADH:ubiquinone oxidoreductase subunit n=1 Tax=Eilatimonas milleporae TaxID=911205 RepID=A0A3M0CIE5_9PROT|nr:NADH:ubiquinone oxidoreductase subunit NDUFA12 [Eilatimonas milleporae]RMB08547.1 NADH:ubiquinone oxidoreductase subunit [Eilatimonas milleporae]